MSNSFDATFKWNGPGILRRFSILPISCNENRNFRSQTRTSVSKLALLKLLFLITWPMRNLFVWLNLRFLKEKKLRLIIDIIWTKYCHFMTLYLCETILLYFTFWSWKQENVHSKLIRQEVCKSKIQHWSSIIDMKCRLHFDNSYAHLHITM